MRLPINIRVRWYEHIDGHTERTTLMEFERWLSKRVDTLFNPLEDLIYEVEQEADVYKTKVKYEVSISCFY